jgi:hypothetical protein
VFCSIVNGVLYGVLTCLCFHFFSTPYFLVRTNYDWADEMFSQPTFEFFQTMTLVAGSVLSVSLSLTVLQPFVVNLSRRCITCIPRVFAYATASSNVRRESWVKWAATRKVNSMLVNADGLHALGRGSLDRRALMKKSTKKALRNVTDETMRNYVLNSAQREIVGGFFWTWRNLANGSLLADEGIWINSRLVVFELCMVVAALAFGYIMLWSVVEAAEAADDARASLDPSTVPEWVYDSMPTGEMVRKSLYPAAVTGIVVSCVLITLYIPSLVSTALQYRSQVRPSLGSIYFNKYRTATQNVSSQVKVLDSFCVLILTVPLRRCTGIHEHGKRSVWNGRFRWAILPCYRPSSVSLLLATDKGTVFTSSQKNAAADS